MACKKTMKRESRLQAAKHWIPKYTGNKIVRGYRKHYGVSLLCAAQELKTLGVEISDGYIEQLKMLEENKRRQNEQQKQIKEHQKLLDMYPDSDDTFYYIAGYTSGGAPYGITWSEMDMVPYGDATDEE